MSRIFRKLHYYFFLCRLFYIVTLWCNKVTKIPIKLGPYFARRQTLSIFHARQPSSTTVYFFNAARRQHQHCYRYWCAGSWVVDSGWISYWCAGSWVVDSGWIIASVLWIICARCLPYHSRDMKRRIEKITPKRKCKFIDDWRRDFAWIAKLPDNGMAQCNLCDRLFDIVWWSHVCSPAPRECMPWWKHSYYMNSYVTWTPAILWF